MNWKAPNLKDALGTRCPRARAHVVCDVSHCGEPLENPSVRCPCGRLTTADMMLDVRGHSAELRARCGTQDRDFICDACRERLFMEGRAKREEFYRHLGAPQETLARIAAARARGGPR